MGTVVSGERTLLRGESPNRQAHSRKKNEPAISAMREQGELFNQIWDGAKNRSGTAGTADFFIAAKNHGIQ